MKSRLILIAFVLCAVALPVSAELPLADKLPNTTSVYVGWAGRSLTFDGSMFGQMLQQKELAEVLGGVRKLIEGEIPPAQRELFNSAWSVGEIAWKHPIAIAVTEVKTNGPPMPSVVVLVDLGKERDAFQKVQQALLAEIKKQFGKENSKIVEADVTEGAVTYKTLTIDKKFVVSLGYIKNVFFLTFGEQTPKQIFAVTPATSLKANAAFAAAMKEVGGENEQIAFYVDVAGLKKKLLPPPTGKLNPATQPQDMIEVLGVGNVSTIAACVRVVERGLLSKIRISTPAPHRGLLMPFAGGVLSEADLAGVPADADFAVAVKLSADAAYAELRRVIRQLSPAGDEEFTHELGQIEEELGFSIRKDILAHLGDTWVLSSAPSQGGFLTGTVLTVTVKDAEKLSATMAKLEKYIVSQCPRKFACRFQTAKAGRTDVRFLSLASKKMPIPVAPAWAIHKGKLYIAGWPQVIQSTIENNGKTSLLKQAGYARFRQKLPAKASMLAYVNVPKITRQVYPLSLLGGTMGLNFLAGYADRPAKTVWPLPLSRLEKYLWPEISTVSADSKGITITSYGSQLSMFISGPSGGAVMVSVLYPSLSRAKGEAKKAVSSANLKGIGMSVMMYAADNNDQFPPDLSALVRENLITANMLVSPVSGRKMRVDAKGLPLDKSDYVYIVNLDSVAPGQLIMAYERLENYKGRGTYVLYVNGAVAWLDRKEFDKALKSTNEYLKKAAGGNGAK